MQEVGGQRSLLSLRTNAMYVMQLISHRYYATEKFKEFSFLAEIQIWIHLDSTVEFKVKMHSMH